jgi:hypothetical protein
MEMSKVNLLAVEVSAELAHSVHLHLQRHHTEWGCVVSTLEHPVQPFGEGAQSCYRND